MLFKNQPCALNGDSVEKIIDSLASFAAIFVPRYIGDRDVEAFSKFIEESIDRDAIMAAFPDLYVGAKISSYAVYQIIAKFRDEFGEVLEEFGLGLDFVAGAATLSVQLGEFEAVKYIYEKLIVEPILAWIADEGGKDFEEVKKMYSEALERHDRLVDALVEVVEKSFSKSKLAEIGWESGRFESLKKIVNLVLYDYLESKLEGQTVEVEDPLTGYPVKMTLVEVAGVVHYFALEWA